MKKNRFIACVIAICFIILKSTSLCFSQIENIYHSSEGHFSFTIPSDWSEASQEVLNALTKAMDQMPGPSVKLATAFYNTKNTTTYMLIRIEKDGKWSKAKIQKMVPGGMLERVGHDMGDLFKDYGRLKFNEPIYDDKNNILYIKTIAQAKESKIVGMAATILNNYGSVTLAFYASEEDFTTAVIYFNQLVESFVFDKGYQYFDAQEEPGTVSKNILEKPMSPLTLPQCLPAWTLLFMSIFLYGKKINWRDIKKSRSYLIKSIVVLVLAVIINRIFLYIHARANTSTVGLDGLEITLTIPIAIVWYIEYKKIKKSNDA